MVHNSKSRSKRYYGEDRSKPHIILSEFGNGFFVCGDWKAEDNRFHLAVYFADKINAARAKS